MSALAVTFSQFQLVTEPDSSSYVVGYMTVNGVNKEVRIPYSIFLAIADTASQAASAASSAQSTAATALSATSGNLMNWALVQSFRLVSATRDSNGAITTASIVWPDGATGMFTADTISTAFPGAIDAWHATYSGPLGSKTVTQPAVTRDSNGAVTVQPAITIA